MVRYVPLDSNNKNRSHTILDQTSCHFEMTEVPEGYNLKDWNIGNLSCEGATMVKGVLSGNTYAAKFNRQDLQGVNAGDAVPLTVKGTFTFKGKQAQIQSYAMVHV